MPFNQLSIKFEIITPLFISGLNQRDNDFSLSSFKGVLRFWWRSLALSQLGDLQKVRNAEKMIFGGSEKEFGKSKILFKLDYLNYQLKSIDFSKYKGVTYLGYGLINYKGKTDRKYSWPTTTGAISLIYKEEPDDLNLVIESLKALSLFGGIGSRSRRGFGSFNIISIKQDEKEIFQRPNSLEKLQFTLKNFCAQNRISEYKPIPSYSAFSNNTRVDILQMGSDPLILLNEFGKKFLTYRSYGRYGKVLGNTSEQNFASDHDLIVNSLKTKVNENPKRIIFGLPHNYYFSSIGTNIDVNASKEKRRASPLFINILKLNEHEFIVITLILRSQFLPSNNKIVIQPKRGSSSIVQLKDDWNVITDFLEGFEGPYLRKSNKLRFDKRIQIFP